MGLLWGISLQLGVLQAHCEQLMEWRLAGATTTAASPALLGVKNSLFWGPTFHLQRPYLSIQESSEKNRHIVRDAEKHGESIAPIHIGHLPPRLTGISGPVPARVVKNSFFGSWDSPILHKVLILRFCGQEKIYSRGHLLEGIDVKPKKYGLAIS